MKRGLIAVVIVLAACAPDSGRVAGAEYHPAWTQWHTGSMSCSGTPQRCTSTPAWPEYHPQSWNLRLMDGEDDGWIQVDETTFHKCPVESHYPECLK